MIKNKSKLIISLLLLLVIIITPNISRADDEEEIAIDEEFKFFTIDELIFNKIPALNVNVFDNTDVESNSITMRIRTSIATWYVAVRNIATVCLGFTIIYVGLRLAISTVASDKANYKKMLINWITAMLIVYFIHIVMILVLNINDSLLKLLSSSSLSTEEIYQTIRTRIDTLSFITWFPAIIIYLVLFIYSLMFLWVYVKRYFTVLILIILAPLVGVKYAIDSAGKGQRSKILSTWLYEFTMNVLLQSLHALIFTVLMGIAVDLATTSILGFIIALVILNFILKADKIFMNIFKFNRSRMVGDVAKAPTNPKEDFASALFIGGVAWNFAGEVKDLALYGGSQVGRLGKFGYRTLTDYLGEREYNGGQKDKNGNSGRKYRRKIEDKKNAVLNKIDNNLNKAYKKINKGKDNQYLSIAVMSRRRDSTGLAAKKQLRKAKSNIKAKFTAPFKFVKNAGGVVLKVGIGVPLAVVKPGAGIALIFDGAKNVISMGTQKDKKGNAYTGAEGIAQFATLGAYGTYKEMKKDKDKMGKIVGYFNQAVMKEDEIEEEFENRFTKTSEEAINRYKKEVKYFITYGNKENINMILRQRMAYRGVLDINDGNIDDVIEKMADDMFAELKIDSQYSKEKAYRIKKAMIDKTKEAYDRSKMEVQAEEFGSLEIANKFSEAIKEEGISTEVDVENIQDITSKFVDEQISFDNENLDSSMEKVASGVMSDLQMEDRTSKEETLKIIETAKQKARAMYKYKEENDPDFDKLSQYDVARSIHSSIKDSFGEKAMKEEFGFGYEEIQDTISKSSEGISFDNFNLDKSMDIIASKVINDLKMGDKASKEETSRIVENARKNARNMFKNKEKSNPNFRKLSQKEVARSIHSSIRDVIGEKTIRTKFGFGDVTSKIEELHNINIQAQDDIKNKVVRENKFIEFLGKKDNH